MAGQTSSANRVTSARMSPSSVGMGRNRGMAATPTMASLSAMKRLVILLLPLALVWSGCAQLLGTADWDRIEATYRAGSAENQTGNYTLVVTPSQISYEVDGKPSSQELPQGTWDLLTTGVRALGARDGQACPGGESVAIEASAGGSVKQAFQASSCDSDDAFAQAKALIEQIVQRLQ